MGSVRYAATMRGVVLGCAMLVLAGCAAPAEPQRMTVIPAPGSHGFPAALAGAMCVGEVSGGEATNPLWMSQVDDAAFRQALEASLAAHGLLAGPGACGYRLDAGLVGLSQPVAGLDLEVTSHVNYSAAAIERPAFLVATISAPFTAGFGDHAIAVVRLKLANEGSIRRNIAMFLDRLRASRPDSR